MFECARSKRKFQDRLSPHLKPSTMYVMGEAETDPFSNRDGGGLYDDGDS